MLHLLFTFFFLKSKALGCHVLFPTYSIFLQHKTLFSHLRSVKRNKKMSSNPLWKNLIFCFQEEGKAFQPFASQLVCVVHLLQDYRTTKVLWWVLLYICMFSSCCFYFLVLPGRSTQKSTNNEKYPACESIHIRQRQTCNSLLPESLNQRLLIKSRHYQTNEKGTHLFSTAAPMQTQAVFLHFRTTSFEGDDYVMP